MARRAAVMLLLLTVLAVGSSGCSTTRVGNAVIGTTSTGTTGTGTGTGSSPAPSTSRPATTSLPAPSTSRSTTSTALCPTVAPSDARGVVGCVRTSLAAFWSGQLDRAVDQPVIVQPTAAQVPEQCRSAISTTSAFTCQIDDTVYLNTSLLDSAKRDFPPSELPYVLATVLGHEFGHVVQAAVKQPGYTDTGSSDAVSQRIEQQADCLDGVWAHSLIAAGRLDQATFVRVTNSFLTSISSNPEIAGHGTPPVRAAALAKGLMNGRPQDCGLATP